MNKQRPPLTMIANGLTWYEVPEYRCYVSGDPSTGVICWAALDTAGNLDIAAGGFHLESSQLNINFWDAACEAITA